MLTREEKTNLMVAWDILSIREDLYNGDYSLLYGVLVGGDEGYTPYADLTDEQLECEFQERLDDLKQYNEVIDLAGMLNEKPIDLAKV